MKRRMAAQVVQLFRRCPTYLTQTHVDVLRPAVQYKLRMEEGHALHRSSYRKKDDIMITVPAMK